MSSTTGEFKVRARWIVLAAVALLIGDHLAPLLVTHSDQDTCTFGPVSNERYRALLAEARRRQATTWARIPWDSQRAATLLNERFDDLSHSMASIYERLAAMHAITRAAEIIAELSRESLTPILSRSGVGEAELFPFTITWM
jgi:hypothetical protein